MAASTFPVCGFPAAARSRIAPSAPSCAQAVSRRRTNAPTAIRVKKSRLCMAVLYPKPTSPRFAETVESNRGHAGKHQLEKEAPEGGIQAAPAGVAGASLRPGEGLLGSRHP